MNKNTDKSIILTSTGFANKKAQDFLLESIEKRGLAKKAAIIATAAEDKEKHKYSKLAYEQFEDMGFSEISFFDFERDDIEKLSDIPVIYVCGGDTYRLLNASRKQNFDKFLAEFLDNDGLYVGVSAGALILTPSIKTGDYKPQDHPDKDLSGFNILPYLIRPHGDKLKIEKTDQGLKLLNLPNDYIALSFPGEAVENVKILPPRD